MKSRRVWAIARKEFLHVIRDLRSLFIAIALPTFTLVLFVSALSLDVNNVPLVVWDQSHSQTSRELISRFTGSRYFSLRGGVSNYRELEHAIDTRRALAALVIPPDFARRVEAGRVGQVQLLVDGSDSNTATFALSYAETIARDFSQNVTMHAMQRAGGPQPRPPVDYRPRVWFNADLESKNYLLPGLIPIVMSMIAAMLTSATIAREWESGTMEQLISTPITGRELILGKFIPYFVIGMVDVLLAVLLGEFVFQVPLRGSALLLFGVSALFLVGALGIGIVISIAAKNQRLAAQMTSMATMLPASMLSGAIYPIRSMPEVLQWITYLFPARYLVSALKAIYMRGVGISVIIVPIALLAIYGVAVAFLADRLFKKKLD